MIIKIKKLYLICYSRIGLSLYVTMYLNKLAAEDKLKYAKASEERVKQELSDEKLSRFLECGARLACAQRWPEAAKRFDEAKARVSANGEHRKKDWPFNNKL